VKSIGKMSNTKVFFSIFKGYCALIVLILPKSFVNGGYFASSMVLVVMSILSTYCALMLIQAGVKTKIMSYSLLCQEAMGKNGRVAIDIMLILI
jgi:amino acid permease